MTAVSLARSLGATGSIVVNTPGGVNSNTLATIKRMAGQAVVGTLTPQTTTAVSLHTSMCIHFCDPVCHILQLKFLN